MFDVFCGMKIENPTQIWAGLAEIQLDAIQAGNVVDGSEFFETMGFVALKFADWFEIQRETHAWHNYHISRELIWHGEQIWK